MQSDHNNPIIFRLLLVRRTNYEELVLFLKMIINFNSGEDKAVGEKLIPAFVIEKQ